MVAKLSLCLAMTLAMLPWGVQAVVPPPKGYVIIEEDSWISLAHGSTITSCKTGSLEPFPGGRKLK
jgi:hypothetical protein